ncbi:MAG: AEC family transporter, partial [Candidatus Atribacteria bacterium]|nr:AEC family transporter [Candidatus Atribacteria bacterium]MCD6350307.1 AEC family transporter [Candidatus Atribacteria bacterium]
RSYLKPLFGAALIKLFLLPLATLGVSQLFFFSPLERGALIMESAMPTLMTSYVIASLYQLDTQLISSGIVLTTLLALGTLPLWSLLF